LCRYAPGGWDVEERIDAEEVAEVEKSSWGLSGAQHVAQMLSGAVVAREGILVVTLKTGENLIKAGQAVQVESSLP
jgi:hypothetical protein